MTAQHTPGPWTRDKDSKRSLLIMATINGVQTSIGEMHNNSALHHGEAEANAELVISAPETAAERDKLKAKVVKLVVALEEAIGIIEGHLGEYIMENWEEFTNLTLPKLIAALTKAKE